MGNITDIAVRYWTELTPESASVLLDILEEIRVTKIWV